MSMFDQIDAAYYRLLASEAREKAGDGVSPEADRHRLRADLLERKANALLGIEA